MRKLNASFDAYISALRATQEHNERLAVRVDETQQLLDRYVAIMGQTEHTARLLINPGWRGAEADELAAYNEAQEALREQERLRREEEERLERERLEREKAEREAQEHILREKEKEKMKGRGRGSTVRGVRGRGA
jgi:methylase of polypeptide subunit release factors